MNVPEPEALNLHGERPVKTPFRPHDVTVDDRLKRLRTFNEQQCRDALRLHGLGGLWALQKTVVKALESRLRRIGREAA